jgi:diguanylate cyclase (GGDEF)-like protein
MKRKFARETLPQSISRSEPPEGDPDRRLNDVSELLKACQELSRILNPARFYSRFAEIVQKKLNVESLAIFVYDRDRRMFKPCYSRGLAVDQSEFNLDDARLESCLLRKEPFPVTNNSGTPLFRKAFKRHQLQRLGSQWWAPLVQDRELVGLLTLAPKINGESFDSFDLYFLQQISDHAAVCLNTSLLYVKRQKEKEDLDKTLYNLSLLYNIGKAMNYISDLKSLLQYILSQAIEITAAEKGSIMLYDVETDLLKIRVLAGLADTAYQEKVNNNEIKCRSFRPGEGIAGRVFQTAQPMVVNKTAENDLFVESDTSYVRSIACIPMVVYNEAIGVINVTNKRNGLDFDDEDVELLKAVADQAAVAVNKAQLWEMAVTDSLTGLSVRRYFMAKFQEELHRADRYNKLLSIIMADLDRFKRVNDNYGHGVGDQVLESVGRFLKENIREVDLAARYGGEEFVLLIQEADKEGAFRLAERLRKNMSKLQDKALPKVSISMGVATYPVDGTDIDSLIRKADAALYEAKQAGRNKTVMYSEKIKLFREGQVTSAGSEQH